jgi:hypothetical protein
MFAYNVELIMKQTEAVTHEESLIQPPFEGNCLNWTLGHIISARSRVLQSVGQTPIWNDVKRARYRSGTAPIVEDGQGILKLDVLRADLCRSQELLAQGLETMTYEDMCQPSGFENNTVAESLIYFHFHEAQHAGQIAHCVQLAGKAAVWPF